MNGNKTKNKLFLMEIFKNSEFSSEKIIIKNPIAKINNSYEKFFLF